MLPFAAPAPMSSFHKPVSQLARCRSFRSGCPQVLLSFDQAFRLTQTAADLNEHAPGPVGRGMGSHPDDRTRALACVPLRRVIWAEEVAEAAMFLTSSGGRFITGHVLPVDGGASATFVAGQFGNPHPVGIDLKRQVV